MTRGPRGPDLDCAVTEVGPRQGGAGVGHDDSIVLTELCDSEVEDSHDVAAARVGDQPDVVRLEVSMHDTQTVRRVERKGDLFDELDDDIETECRRSLEQGAQGGTLEILHDEIGDFLVANRSNAEVGHVDDVRVPKAPRRSGLAAEALDRARVGHQLRQDRLDRDRAPRSEMLGLVDGAHPTPADQRIDPVLAVKYLAEKRLHLDFRCRK